MTVTEQIQKSLLMSCPRCKIELSPTDDPFYGKVYVCEACGILVIELNAHVHGARAFKMDGCF